MKRLKLLFLFPFLASLQNVSAGDATVTLQNGLNGYNGCDDAWLPSWLATTKFGSDDTLMIEYEQCTT